MVTCTYKLERKEARLPKLSWDFGQGMKIYIAGPYGRRKGLSSLQCQANVDKAVEVARRLINLGYIPFVPHLYHYVHTGWQNSLNEDRWFEACAAWLSDCQAIYMMKGWRDSLGACKEWQLAQEMGLQVYYEDMTDRY